MSLSLDIVKRYPGFTLDVALEAGDERIALLGASGCGKSCTLRCIAGVERPDEGRIEVNGVTFFDSERGIDLSPQQRKCALLFQSYQLFPNMTALDNVRAGMDPALPADRQRADARRFLTIFGMDRFADRFPARLSGGQQQRVALARMLAARPGILMLDEPFSALDSHLKGVLEQNLVSLFDAFEGTILYVSHDIDESLRFCDRIAVVDAGRIVEMDAGRELVNRPQSVAGLKLSGCKNAPAAVYAGPHAVHVPPWGIDVHTAQEVPRDVKCLGLRAFYVERTEGPGENCYRVRVDRVSDARFERMALLGFLDRDDADGAAVAFEANEMSYLHQHMFWRVSMREGVALPEVGEKLWVRIPPDKVYLVSR